MLEDMKTLDEHWNENLLSLGKSPNLFGDLDKQSMKMVTISWSVSRLLGNTAGATFSAKNIGCMAGK